MRTFINFLFTPTGMIILVFFAITCTDASILAIYWEELTIIDISILCFVMIPVTLLANVYLLGSESIIPMGLAMMGLFCIMALVSVLVPLFASYSETQSIPVIVFEHMFHLTMLITVLGLLLRFFLDRFRGALITLVICISSVRLGK